MPAPLSTSTTEPAAIGAFTHAPQPPALDGVTIDLDGAGPVPGSLPVETPLQGGVATIRRAHPFTFYLLTFAFIHHPFTFILHWLNGAETLECCEWSDFIVCLRGWRGGRK